MSTEISVTVEKLTSFNNMVDQKTKQIGKVVDDLRKNPTNGKAKADLK